MSELTTTSYAILGLLSLRPHTAYELAAQSDRSLRYLWPTAPSRLYAEPKRLVGLGLIDVEDEPAGPVRTRQRFRITADGRRALAAWLDTPVAPPRVEVEALLRTFLGDAGDRDALVATLEATRDAAEAEYRSGIALVEAYRSGENPYPERLHLNLLWIVFVRDLLQLVGDWGDFAASEVRRWPAIDDPGSRRRLDRLLDAIAEGDEVVPRRGPPEAADGPA